MSLASQEDIPPLKEACLILGVSSLMARLEELSFSMQCLPKGYDQQPPFRPTTEVTDPPALSGEDNSNLVGINAVVAQGPTSGGNDGSVVNAFETTSTAQMDLSKREPEPGISTPPAPTPEEEAVAAVTAAAAADEDDFEASFNEIVEQREEPQPSDLPPVPPSSHPMPPALTKAPPQLQQQKAFSAIHEPSPPQPAPPPLPLPPPSTMKKRPFPCGQCSSRFHSAESLAAHERMHAGKKPFVWDAIQCCRDTILKDYISY